MKPAEAVRKYLRSKVFDETAVQAVSMGEERPLGNNRTARGRAANCRVDIKEQVTMSQ